jgi:hypothetical protein
MNGVEADKIIQVVYDFCRANPDKKPISAIDQFIRDAKKVDADDKDVFSPWDE